LRRCKRGLHIGLRIFLRDIINYVAATKFIISLKKYSYNDRLIQLNLPTLKYRRLRCKWDMLEVFKIVKQKYDTTFSSSILTAEMKTCLTPLPRLVCGTRLVTAARLLSDTSESDFRPVCVARRTSIRGSAYIRRFIRYSIHDSV